MKLACQNIDNEFIHYYTVDDNYDFATYSAVDETTIVNWDKYGVACGLTFSGCREQIKILVDASGIENMNATEKDVASRWFIFDKATRDTIHTEDQQKNNAKRIHHYQKIEDEAAFISSALNDDLFLDYSTNVVQYEQRNKGRGKKLDKTTMSMVGYFLSLGDDMATASSKVTQLSTDVSGVLFVYVLGNKQPLVDAINASTLPFMDESAKTYLISLL